MLLSHPHRFIYLKTVKTAGTSVEIYFEDACIPPDRPAARGHHIEQTVTSAGVIGYRGPDPSGRTWYNHMPAEQVRELVGRDVWDTYYKFCVVRNPFEKMVSLWWFIRSKQDRSDDLADFARIKADFCSWCVCHAPDAVDRDKYLIDGKVSVDCFVRYESLLDGLQAVCRQVGYPFRPERLGTFKSDSRLINRPFADYYDRPAIAAVEAAFSWELDHFGYPRLR